MEQEETHLETIPGVCESSVADLGVVRATGHDSGRVVVSCAADVERGARADTAHREVSVAVTKDERTDTGLHVGVVGRRSVGHGTSAASELVRRFVHERLQDVGGELRVVDEDGVVARSTGTEERRVRLSVPVELERRGDLCVNSGLRRISSVEGPSDEEECALQP